MFVLIISVVLKLLVGFVVLLLLYSLESVVDAPVAVVRLVVRD